MLEPSRVPYEYPRIEIATELFGSLVQLSMETEILAVLTLTLTSLYHKSDIYIK